MRPRACVLVCTSVPWMAQASGGAAASGHTAAMEVQRVPTQTPPFTLSDLRRAVPAHCFEKSTLRSSMYLLKDLLISASLVTAAVLIEHPVVPRALAWAVLYPLYWFCQVRGVQHAPAMQLRANARV